VKNIRRGKNKEKKKRSKRDEILIEGGGGGGLKKRSWEGKQGIGGLKRNTILQKGVVWGDRRGPGRAPRLPDQGKKKWRHGEKRRPKGKRGAGVNYKTGHVRGAKKDGEKGSRFAIQTTKARKNRKGRIALSGKEKMKGKDRKGNVKKLHKKKDFPSDLGRKKETVRDQVTWGKRNKQI